jgi:secretion/DNA translocation related TadE-like protein
VLWLAGLVVLLLAQVADARARAAAAADLAGLAAASHVVTGDACPYAAVVARAQSAKLDACAVDGWEVRVLVSVRLKGPLADLPAAEARAHAGPPRPQALPR